MTATPPPDTQLRERILDCLATFANQRPGCDPRDYGAWRAYRSESRSITRDLADFRILLSAVRWRASIDAPRLIEAFRAFSGRLTCKVDGTRVTLDYCTGQYFPTEYRKAACAVLASALWDWTRDCAMPAPSNDDDVSCGTDMPKYDGMTAGDWLRRHFRREFGARIQKRWFD